MIRVDDGTLDATVANTNQVHDQLEDLILRLEAVVKSTERPIQLHWSDVETLRLVARERRELSQRVDGLRRRLGGLLDEIVGKRL